MVFLREGHADSSSFVHSVGMYESLSGLQEVADISLAATAHLDRAHLELQARIQEAEERLAVFYFDDAHFAQEDMSPTVRAASIRFRKFLKQFYEKEYQGWPMKRGRHGLWLDRTVVRRLQEDLNALYEYNVDRSVEWNGDAEIEDRKNRVLLRSVNGLNFGLDGDDLRMLGVLTNVDCRLNATHIPHPYPLLPPSIPRPSTAKSSVLIGKRKDRTRESRIAHAYAEASNASSLTYEHADNDLLEAFVRFEKTDQPSDVDPREARRERWIIIYCVLQTLAGISVDVPNLSFSGGVSYFLNTRLHGLPPWSPADRMFMDASREQSHCWTTARTWSIDPLERSIAHSSSNSYVTSDTTSLSRPLSPSTPLDTYTFLDSNRDTTYSEPEADDPYRIDDFSPATKTKLSADPEYPVMPSKAATIVNLSRHTNKSLPIRPGQEVKRDREVRRPE